MKIWAVGQTGGVAHYARYFCIDRCSIDTIPYGIVSMVVDSI